MLLKKSSTERLSQDPLKNHFRVSYWLGTLKITDHEGNTSQPFADELS